MDFWLCQLGVNLVGEELWPLTVYPRTLALLAEIILLRQQREYGAGLLKRPTDMLIFKLWARFIATLKGRIINQEACTEAMEDVNVEHMQLLLFLFHSIDLMQKKHVILQLGQTILDIHSTVSTHQLMITCPLLLSRLLLLFDYMLHYLYDPPKGLIAQVQLNLFGIKSHEMADSVFESHFTCKEVEDNYRKTVTDVADVEMNPRFYNLAPPDFIYNTQDVPKIDGLACTFILGNPDVLNYNVFYQTIISLLAAGSKYKPSTVPGEKTSALDTCSVHYYFLVCWRLLNCLPPSVGFMKMLADGTVPTDETLILHTLRWAQRVPHKVFSSWIKDWLVKQGQTIQQVVEIHASAVETVENISFHIQMVLQFHISQVAAMSMSREQIMSKQELPSFGSVLTLDCVLAKVHVLLDDLYTKSLGESDQRKSMEVAQDLFPRILNLIEGYSAYIKCSVLNKVDHFPPVNGIPLDDSFAVTAYSTIIGIGSSHASKVSLLGSCIMSSLPPPVKNAVEHWQNNTINEFPPVGAWRNAFANDIIPSESYVDAVLVAHLSALSAQTNNSIQGSLKHALQSLVRFCGDLSNWCPDDSNNLEMVNVLFPLIFDTCTEHLADYTVVTLERILGPVDEELFNMKMYEYVIEKCYQLLTRFSKKSCNLDEKIFHDVLKFMENHLEKPLGKKAFENFYSTNGQLVNILLSTSNEHLTTAYDTKVLKLVNKLFQLAEKNPADKSYKVLCSSLIALVEVDSGTLHSWLSKMILGPQQNCEDGGKTQENRLLLQALTTYIVKEQSHVSEEVAKTILYALIPMGSKILSPTSEGIGFSELMVVMATLAGAGSGNGHRALFKAATCWLELCKTYLSQKDVIQKIQKLKTVAPSDGNNGGFNSGSKVVHQTMLESTCYLLSYIGDILGALKITVTDNDGMVSPLFDSDLQLQEVDSDWVDDLPDDEGSNAEDSDEESLNNKLCTFTVTQKEFMNQHWYHCHTCKMIDGVGVCTICAKVCHKDHELSYAKYGSFFCDCGAKDDGSCQALVKRAMSGIDAVQTTHSGQSPFSMETMMLTSSLRRCLTSTSHSGDKLSSKTDKVSKAKEALCKQIESCKDALISYAESSNTVNTVLELMLALVPSIMENYQKVSIFDSATRARKVLEDLHTMNKTTEISEQLMTATLGSQEGAFENVRMNYSGDQGQTIRQLITAHMLRRVAMCCLATPQGRRQHLAVSHEKGKITILQLSALLKQADSSKRKLTLTRLASAPIPFTVLSIIGNQCNEDFLAVCGLKDCHVLTFTPSGSVSDHLVLHPSLETGNFIIKAVWLPGSQTELALVTADFVKIYDLSLDAISPQYYFLLPSGKVRDCTFVVMDEVRTMVLMTSSGYMCTQQMDEASSAKHGPFYITNILEAKHGDLKDQNGQVGLGGVSVHYSHMLQLLFFSFSCGKSFVAAIDKDVTELSILFPINFKSTNGNSKAGGNQALVQWMEVAGHPGLVCCMTQLTNNPVVMMIKPDAIVLQEIKILPAKAKIQDMVAIRHSASNSDQRTTLILLCEDGSLRIYMANVDQTSYWLSPALQPASTISALKPIKKRKTAKAGRPTNVVSFPVDFFEHCQQSNDVEFSGNDVLQVYNCQQVKHRLNTNGLYIASTKPTGFTLDITHTNPNNVVVGIRVLLGNHSAERAPVYLEIFGRNTPVFTRSRWYDLALTREESLLTDKKFSIFFGASADASGVTIIDSVKLYTKTKEAFGWPEDTDDIPDTGPSKSVLPVVDGSASNGYDPDITSLVPLPLTATDRLLASSLEVLDGCFSVTTLGEDGESARQAALDLATSMLTIPVPSNVQQYTKSLLAALHSNRTAYYNHKDQAQLSYVVQCLMPKQVELDGEAFQRLLVTARSVAVARPINFVRFTEADSSTMIEDHKSGEVKNTGKLMDISPSESNHFMVQLVNHFWDLLAKRPVNPALAPACLPGLTHIEATVSAIVDIIHSYTSVDLDSCNLATKLYVRMLLCEDPTISFSCKQAMVRALRPRHRRRRVFIPSPPHCSTPGGTVVYEDDEAEKTSARGRQKSPQLSEHVAEINYEEEMELEPEEASAPPNPSPLEALLGSGNFPPMLDIPPDADDETMVELAIALSLQEQPGQSGGLRLQSLGLGVQSQVESSHYSDTTASAPGSDDEVGSTAATDGSTLRTSPAEHGGSAGSESGGSAIDSISGEQNVSGRSSAYGDAIPESATTGARSETSSIGIPMGSMHHEEGLDTDADYDKSIKLHDLRLRLLERLLEYLPEVRDVGGVRAIPYMQVLHMLTCDLDSDEEKDRLALDNLLTSLLAELNFVQEDVSDADEMCRRTPFHEVRLIIMRLLSVLMSKGKMGLNKSCGEYSSFISNMTASCLLNNDAINYCLKVLRSLLDFWKLTASNGDSNVLPGQLLRPHPATQSLDMAPFFQRQYVKGHANDVFEDYQQLLTEMVLRLPYQIKKIADGAQAIPQANFDQSWFHFLCEYMMTQQAPFVRRQVRKLLLFICGSKEKYRQLRDLHALSTHIKEVRNLCGKNANDLTVAATVGAINLQYDQLITLIEHLKACADIASNRSANWEKFCLKDESIIPFLIHASIVLDEGIAPVLLQLLHSAICGSKATIMTPNTKQRKEKEKAEESGESTKPCEENMCLWLVQQINRISRDSLVRFLRTFLLESNSTAVRWQAHGLILQIYRNFSTSQQESLLDLMWGMWPELPMYGRKAVQFVDLLGYFSLKTESSEKRLHQVVEKAIAVLRCQNQLMTSHSNANIYNQLQGMVDFDGYYLESDPCLVCNNPEVPFVNIKLTSIKVDSKFTTTTQIVKLIGSHNIAKVTLRISDLKRTKMVRTISFYYNNRSVAAVVELKNRPGLWHKAKKVTLSAGQTEVKVEFPLPITACNLMIEYGDFYDNFQASAETLSCPRCSASVPANPGVCSNCGENVFQCHKCRAINYDEKDPFLCNACGFCKYAKFDYTLNTRPCCAVDPVESEDDRKKTISTINSLLEKADRVYKQLQIHRPILESLLIRINEHSDKSLEEIMHIANGAGIGATPGGTTSTNTNHVNKGIQQLAMRYAGDCKNSFDDLSKIIQKVMASRRELVAYDQQQKEAALTAAIPATAPERTFSDRSAPVPRIQRSSGRCYGCASATVDHSITLLRALATNTSIRQLLCAEGLIKDLIEYNLRRGTASVRTDVRHLLCLLTKDNREATDMLNTMLMDRITNAMHGYLANPDLGASVRHEILLLASSVQKEDSCWELRLRAVLQLFLSSIRIKNPVVMESITLPCLRILHHIIKPDIPLNKKSKEKSKDFRSSVKTTGSDLHVDAKNWLSGDPDSSYLAWRKELPTKVPSLVETGNDKLHIPPDKNDTRALFLMEKYGNRWKSKVQQEKTLPLQLVHGTWLRQALFTPSSRAARQTACNIIESICQIHDRHRKVLDLLTGYLDELCRNGENTAEFLALYKRLINPAHWKHYLAIKGILPIIGGLIMKEIDKLSTLEETTLNSDLSLGYALRALTELLSSFVDQENIKQRYKSRLVGPVLNGYLSLRKLVVQRTKLIDETQDKLLDLLEDMTTGTESETREFMFICVETLQKYPLDDYRSPVFIFERLCSIIYPEENDVGQFFISLDKDLQQEDFLQGRMLGNPYSSNEPGLGPLMRDVKNKICQGNQ
ncbi:E3 ubiquitin-protein ligase UBR4-like [Tubulanus polymorphus]|uniref:E3 ubiquitin-protein ligase UBR4-like n=1 Tax=Tubulanus polymorphus TaxID=672921 RepID=UPI003DA58BD8